ncbi:hypothetical protein EDD18DRAFT_844979 [Armillaria luteobubalina]|uniref:Uncharacterized protein n=1 Tax=Armillaria luteobubalina TaxID=153913 RepID=A0AA39P9M2_9AGAR|nr:hypothetical protein EDD18DRAFT_844979 [Armillaria luteobubalina]
MLGIMLDRARPHDLNVIIAHKDDISTRPAYAVLLPSVRYWKSLEVIGIFSNFDFLSPCRGYFDRLETATVWGYHRGESEAIDTFVIAPHLRSFENCCPLQFLLPANLVEFNDGNLFNENTCTTLRHLVNIQILSLKCSSYSSESSKIRLPRVFQLKLIIGQTMGTAPLTYNHFDLPSLIHLKILFRSSAPMDPQQTLQPMRSSTVTRLTLTWCPFKPEEIPPSEIELALSSCSTLTNLQCLTVEVCPHINLFLVALSIRPGKNVIFPKMSKLNIRFVSGDVLDMRVLVELVESRRDQGALREFEITWKQELVNDDADIRSRWQQLSGPGGGIQISASIKGL